ncbi:DUF6415 family natural product biosynthesis protein [Streptomyces sp. URMC 129]|uniref:DUF6415 family natural product biosynthesis protein n=1 Tax=Streptomyces sp. URMC 129 TaxID=3423407 RepID=UPI003F1AA67A
MNDLVYAEEMRLDIALAMALAKHHPTGDAVDALRKRLRRYVRTLLPDAQAHIRALTDSDARRTARTVLREADRIAADMSEGTDPAASLRLLAKAVDVLSGYAIAGQQSAGTETAR